MSLKKCNCSLKEGDNLKKDLFFFSQIIYRSLFPLIATVYNLENISHSSFKNTSREITWALKHSDVSDIIKK